jgi:hypothetical protein
LAEGIAQVVEHLPSMTCKINVLATQNKYLCEVMDILIILIVVIISKSALIFKYDNVLLKYTQFLFVNCTSTKLEIIRKMK